ncbi:MAG TPA: aspartate carbamoyltransferase catalytic subunit [Bacillota bacterium]|nr:aspartate carbamoyltransferase catalytic subunit [Bacillota bacterium]
MKHFISVSQLQKEDIFSLLRLAAYLRRENQLIHKQLFVANLFFEPSTRTKMSFTVAQKKLGLEVLDFHADQSSAKKGESLYDTVKTFEAIGANLLVIRHPKDNWIVDLEKISIPIINAGAGKEEHPTQCMLDLLTIYEEFKTFDDLNVSIVGDIKHSRVAHSHADALQRLGANVYFSAAPGFEDESLDIPYVSMDEAVKISDVVMLLRIQHERHENKRTITENYLESYGMTKSREKQMKKQAIIMHPAPMNRGVEIDSDLVECRRSRIFKQMENGVYMRMAIITKLLQKWGIIDENITKKCQDIKRFKRAKTM